MRLGQLARQLKVKPSEIVKFLMEEVKVEVENGPNVKLEQSHIDLVMEKLTPKPVEEVEEKQEKQEEVKEEKAAEAPKKVEKKKVEARKTTSGSDDNEVFPDPKSIVVNPNAELIRAVKPDFQGFKVVDKIDLPETNEKTVIEVDGVMLSPEEIALRKEKEQEEREIAIAAERKRKEEERAEREKKKIVAEEKRLEKLAVEKEKKRKREAEEKKRKEEAEAKKKKEERTIFYKEQMKTNAGKTAPKKKKKRVVETGSEVEEEKVPEVPKTGLAKLWHWFNT